MKLATSTISEIESGKRVVTGDELYRFAKPYERPLSFFFEEGETSESPGFAYLFRQVNEGVLKRGSLLGVERLTEDYALIEELTGAPALPRVPDYVSLGLAGEEGAETLAETERARLDLGDAPLKDLMNLLDSTVGIRTFLVPVPNQNWSGLIVRDRSGRPTIAVDAKESFYRRNFDLAHEYAHVLVHLSKTGTLQARIDAARDVVRNSGDERFADAFATAFLMPRRESPPRARASPRGGWPGDVLAARHASQDAPSSPRSLLARARFRTASRGPRLRLDRATGASRSSSSTGAFSISSDVSL